MTPGTSCAVMLLFLKEYAQPFLSLLDFPRNVPVTEVALQLPKFC